MKMNQKEYWDQAAGKKEFTTPFQMACFKRHVSQKASILDLGCGYGRVMKDLSDQGFQKICGVDFSAGMVERGKLLYPHLDLRKTAMPLAFEDKTFDVVLLVAVLTCIVEDDGQHALMKEIIRVLKPQGKIYINDFLINSDQRNMKRYKASEEKYGLYGVFELDEGAVLRHHTEDHLSNLTASFKPIEYNKLVYTTMNKNQSKGFYYLGELRSKAR